MSVRFDSFTDTLYRSTSPFSANSAYTIMAWVCPVVLPGTSGLYYSVMAAGVNGSSGYDWIEILNPTGTFSQFELECFGTVFNQSDGTTHPSINTWYHLALVREDTSTLKLYVNGLQEGASITDSVAGRAATVRAPNFGGAFATDTSNCRMAAAKVWTAGLAAEAIQREMYTIRPCLSTSANLWAWYPMFPGAAEYVKDYSGNGRDLTAAGTLVDEDPPPISYGAPVWAVTTFPAAVVSKAPLPVSPYSALRPLLAQ